MPTFNLSIDPAFDIDEVASELVATDDVIVNNVFKRLRVLNVYAQVPEEFTWHSAVLKFEEEVKVTPKSQFAWQQLRIATQRLPLKPTARYSYRGDGVVVYLVDTGIDLSHPDLANTSIIEELWSHDGTFTPAEHGTILATLINGEAIGISPNSIIKSVHIPVGQNVAVSTLLEAFEAIHEDHAQTDDVKIVNCSWVIEKSQILDAAIADLQAAGLVVVAAAGNQGVAADSFSPAGLGTVIGVAASDAYDRVISWSAGQMSNWGPEVDITAPGIDLDIINTDGTTGTLSGTSAAAAIVSAILTHYIEHNPSATAAEIQQTLIEESLEDMLFRNESIYGTTPNRLVRTYTPNTLDSWGIENNQTQPVQRGTTKTITIPYTLPITEVTYVDFTFTNEHEYKALPWVTIVDGELTIAPTADVPVGVYPIILTGTDFNGNEYHMAIKAAVFVTDPSETGVSAPEGESYLNADNEYVLLKLQFCSTDGECTTWADSCCKGHECISPSKDGLNCESTS